MKGQLSDRIVPVMHPESAARFRAIGGTKTRVRGFHQFFDLLLSLHNAWQKGPAVPAGGNGNTP